MIELTQEDKDAIRFANPQVLDNRGRLAYGNRTEK